MNADSAANARKAREAMLNAGIRQAAGALPSSARSTPAIVQRRISNRGPQVFGLNRIPSLKTIRRHLRTPSIISQNDPITNAPAIIVGGTEHARST